MKTYRLLLFCVCAQSALTFSAAGVELFKTDDHSKVTAADLALEANARMHAASSREDYQEAAALLEKAVRLDPDNMDVRQTLGWVYLDRLHEPRKAYHQLAVVAEKRPDDANARKLLGMACSQTGRSEKAVVEFRAASRLDPNDLWIRASLARALARTGRRGEAERIDAEILKVDPNNAEALLSESEIEAWRGHSEGPLQTLDQLNKSNPTNTDVLTLRGDIHRWNWDLTEARQDYQSALAIEPDNYDARNGMAEARRMGASGLTGKAYDFKDTTDFRREYLEADGRVHLTDHAYLIGGVAGWRFTNPGFSDLNRGDGSAGLEYDFTRWLQATAEGNVFNYDNRPAFYGGQFSTKISPMTDTSIYGTADLNQPFISSINTVQNGYRQDSAGLGLDTTLGGRFSLQASGQAARLSDDNKWWEVTPQLSYCLIEKLATFIRVQYDYLSYSQVQTAYWTPRDRHTVGPVLDTSIPICKSFHLVGDAKAPYIFDESQFGVQVEGGPEINLFNHVLLKGTYYYSSIPGDQGAWSGQGWMASLQISF